jgi:hypothetical protein
MGSVLTLCDGCGRERWMFRSCRNRNCPGCQAEARAGWLAAREKELLPVPYFHVVFTVPEVFNVIALYCPEAFYAALLRAAGNALLDVGRVKLKARMGCLTVLHTWGQNLSLHPHVHCVVPGGGFSLEGTRWNALRKASYLLPVSVLRARFKTVLCQSLYQAIRNGELARLPKSENPWQIIAQAAMQQWIVYAKRPFGGPEQVLEYLSRYTHRVAISNARILSFSDGQVSFRWRDYADGNRSKIMTLDAVEFLRRFLLHVLPDGFVRIRYFGFLGNHNRNKNIEAARKLIGCSGELRFRKRPKPPVLCSACYADRRSERENGPFSVHELRPPPPVTYTLSHLV